jgi:hypothetical protein
MESLNVEMSHHKFEGDKPSYFYRDHLDDRVCVTMIHIF